MMRELLTDFRYALRNLRRSPAFTAVALASLALGIGANSAIFTLLDQALLRRLPVQHPEQLVLLKFNNVDRGSINNRDDGGLYFSYPMYRDLRDKNAVFSGMAATKPFEIAMSWRAASERATGELVSGNYFDVLGVRPAMGRLFTASDDAAPGANPAAVLSFGCWEKRFGLDPAVLNQTVRLNGHVFTVVGVTQPGFRSVAVGDAPDVFVPMTMIHEAVGWDDALEERRFRWLNIVVRLKPGITRQQAEAGILPLWRALRDTDLKGIKAMPASFRSEFLSSPLWLLEGGGGLNPLRNQLSTPLIALMAMVGLVLLMACANVANLVLARAANRESEIAVRFALGARRTQIVRTLLAENVTLAVAGGALAVLLASWISSVLVHMLPVQSGLQLAFSTDPDARVLAFTL
ncbi:MAG TPA: ABC transporter permease, partial [Bryobacteraceae bacterium]|nr:ABC transporter permease [Bryobacteraceae bacterium]